MFKFEGLDWNKKYKYPGAKLVPGTELHDKLVTEIIDKAIISKSKIRTKYPAWNEMNKQLGYYAVPETGDITRNSKSANAPSTIVVPEMQAIQELLLTAMGGVFDSIKPVMLRGVGPEDVPGAMLLESVINDDLARNRVFSRMDVFRSDVLKYGFGPISIGYVSGNETYPYLIGGEANSFRMFSGTGNIINNLDPYSFLPDPQFGVIAGPSCRFVGFVDNTQDVFWLYEKENSGEGYFNIHQALLASQDDSMELLASKYEDKGLWDEYGTNLGPDRDVRQQGISVLYAYVKLIPSQWGLSDSDDVERWVFVITSGYVLIYAQKVSFEHQRVPLAVGAPDWDGHSILPKARLGSLMPLQKWLNFLLNSRWRNIARTLNGIFVVNPSIINMFDLDNPEDTDEGLLVRVLDTAWGDPDAINKGIKQLEVADVTQSNGAESSNVRSLMRDVTGATTALQGMSNRNAERVTAREVSESFGRADSRVQRLCKLIYEQVNYELAVQCSFNTLQFMDTEAYVRVYSGMEETLKSYGPGIKAGSTLRVSKEAMQVGLDVVPHSLAFPRANDRELISMGLELGSRLPALQNKIDFAKLFLYLMKVSGMSNVEEFVIGQQQQQLQQMQNAQNTQANVEVRPGEEVARDVERGNLVQVA